jgi:hypothetical protein
MSHPSISVDLSFDQLISVVKNLQPEEKSILNEALWDEDALIPSEHQAIVLDRITKTKKNPERLVDWNTASKSL